LSCLATVFTSPPVSATVENPVKIIGRRDRLLLVGFIVATIVVFARPVRYLLEVAQDVERSSGLLLVPALIILTISFFFHLQAKRQESRERALRAEAETVEAEARAAEMELLVAFGQALGRSLDLDAIRDVVAQQLPRLAGVEGVWVLLRSEGRWHALVGAGGEGRRETERTHQLIADRAFVSEPGVILPPTMVIDGHLCIPLTAGGYILGVVGVPESAASFSDARRRLLAAGLALLGISVRNAQLFREVRENGLRDGLTGCYNRTHAVEVIATELRRARRSHAEVSLIMFDLDHFKQINDRYGHLAGDSVLAAVGSRMRTALRSSDFKCRYGGEEFLVLLPATPLAGAKHVAETLRRELSELQVVWKEELIQVTASFGVTVALPSEIDLQAFIGRADAALYRAKDQGRNCIRLANEAVPA
jgi:diguanylate cyclase (GGDEF)-like protein